MRKLKVMSESNGLVSFQPGTVMLADRARAEEVVERCLVLVKEGALPDDAERQRVDIKEEASQSRTPVIG